MLYASVYICKRFALTVLEALFIVNVIKLSKTHQRIFVIIQSCIGMIWGFYQLSEVLGIDI